MKITKSELESRYGINLGSGKYDIKVIDNVYSISTAKDDTDGCILIGQNCSTTNGQMISGSVLAYRDLYPLIQEQIEAGYPVNIEVI